MPNARPAPSPSRESESRFAPDGTPVMCPPGHWACRTPVPRYMADALDEIARDAGLPDGLAVLIKAARRTLDDLGAADREMLRAWWRECYAWAGLPASRGYGDVVMYVSAGIFGIGSGAGELHAVEGASRPPGTRRAGLVTRRGVAWG